MTPHNVLTHHTVLKLFRRQLSPFCLHQSLTTLSLGRLGLLTWPSKPIDLHVKMFWCDSQRQNAIKNAGIATGSLRTHRHVRTSVFKSISAFNTSLFAWETNNNLGLYSNIPPPSLCVVKFPPPPILVMLHDGY